MNRALAIILIALFGLPAFAQVKEDDAEEARDKDLATVAQAYRDAIRAAHPPLDENIEVTMEEVSPLEMLHNPMLKKDVGSLMTFLVQVKNIGQKDFDYVPGDVMIQVFDEDGKQLPDSRVRRRESGHGDSGTYPIPHGEINAKPIRLIIEDKDVKVGTKYLVVASYVKIWEKPSVRFDIRSVSKPVEAREKKAGSEKTDNPITK